MRYYRIGGLAFCINFPHFTENEDLKSFRAETCKADVTYDLTLCSEQVLPGGNPVHSDTLRLYYRVPEGLIRVFIDECDGGVLALDMPQANGRHICFDQAKAEHISSGLVLKFLDLPHRMLEHGGIFLHASFIEVGGQAILFTAPKQTGKSTQAELWHRYREAEIINGDRALVRKKNGKWYAWGSPYCGTSDICLNRELPIRAIVILSQAEENTARRVDARKALAALLDGCTFDSWDAVQVEKVMDIFDEILKEIPFYQLACTPDERAVKALEEVL